MASFAFETERNKDLAGWLNNGQDDITPSRALQLFQKISFDRIQVH